jgi:CubicO group peptidase (beta-lactamase class C family)
MNKSQTTKQQLLTLFIIAFQTYNALGQVDNSDQGWQQYANVEEVGYSSDSLRAITAHLTNSKSEAVMVVLAGNVLFSHGDNARRYAIHSMRKGLMNAMIGIEIARGTLRLNQTLDELNIDDIGQLTVAEKKATLKDLLSARAGVYHPSAYYERSLVKLLPARGSHAPGSNWSYNNWDFNVLHTIYEQQSKNNFFQSFETEIADEIGMEDFRTSDTYLRLESDKSIHPAYLFKMSSRDLARFGLLYLNHGRWGNQQLIPENWIQTSTRTVTTSEGLGPFKDKGAYGLLWWVDSIAGRKTYYASGAGGHRVIIIPEEDLVIVHRVNTYEGARVGVAQINQMVSEILNAQTGAKTINSPKLTPFITTRTPEVSTVNINMDQFLGTYKHRLFGDMTIQKSGDSYQLLNGIGIFNLFTTSHNTFYIEDMNTPIRMEKLVDPEQKITIKPVMSNDRKLQEVVFYY